MEEEKCCASCGIAEADDVKLKECDDCDLVRYCSDTCQRDHRPEHEAKCSERAAELSDELLFKQPESSHFGDCPICCLPIPVDHKKSTLMACCSKRVCDGCHYANQIREAEMRVIQFKCLFCRQPMPDTDEEGYKIMTKRVEANDPVAIGEIGNAHWKEGDYDSAFEYWTKAAELGDATAHYHLSIMYRKGDGVEKDETKEINHLEQASIRGHAYARHALAAEEGRKGRSDNAVKHLIIAASLGYDVSIKALKELYKEGIINKDDFASALRAHHAAVNATKSSQRETSAKADAAGDEKRVCPCCRYGSKLYVQASGED